MQHMVTTITRPAASAHHLMRDNNCREDIDKFNKSYMFVFAQNKNSSNMIYLCGECKDKLKDILNSEV